jgi:2'-5' RNA ligase
MSEAITHASPDATMTAIAKVVAARPDGMTTIGVAIGVPDPWATQIRTAREGLGDPQAHAIPTHVTLIAPADVPMQNLPAIDEHLAVVAGQMSPIRIQLRGTATFRPVSPVVFLNVVQGISGCERLEKAVRRGPLLRRRRFPYHPHVTLVHNMADEVLDQAFDLYADFSATFVADCFTLYQQDSQGVWHSIRTYRMSLG